MKNFYTEIRTRKDLHDFQSDYGFDNRFGRGFTENDIYVCNGEEFPFVRTHEGSFFPLSKGAKNHESFFVPTEEHYKLLLDYGGYIKKKRATEVQDFSKEALFLLVETEGFDDNFYLSMNGVITPFVEIEELRLVSINPFFMPSTFVTKTKAYSSLEAQMMFQKEILKSLIESGATIYQEVLAEE